MSYQSEREEFLSVMGANGVRAYVARPILAAANRLQKLAELACSSERADRDRVRCPAARRGESETRPCLCLGYGSYDANEQRKQERDAHLYQGSGPHGTVPRYMVTEARIERRLRALCGERGLTVEFQGDPRGYVVKVSKDGREYGVPANGYSTAQMERICS